MRAAKAAKDAEDDEEEGDDEVLSEASEELDYSDDDENEKEGEEGEDNDSSDDNDDDDVEEEEEEDIEAVAASAAIEAEPHRERKRKRKDAHDNLEDQYMAQLAKEDEEPESKRNKVKDAEAQEEAEGSDDDEETPVHESLTDNAKTTEIEKASRTVFLANVSTEAISSKAAKKTLMTHLSTAFDKDAYPAQKVESIRFRSVAFSTAAMPKRAAYITKSLMDATTKSTNAYAVMSTDAAARRVVQQLNGTEVLGRHVRVDSVAHPSPTDHRRCIFVGNLGFVDDETIVTKNSEGEEQRKKRNKVPSDIEEGLWREFSKTGKVENVRVVRDSKTRVGKGFAYVQFYDANDVEAALLLNDKSFPPMLPRKLRVTRAKDPRKTASAIERSQAKANGGVGKKPARGYVAKATPEQLSAAGRHSRLLGRSGAKFASKGTQHGDSNSSLPDGIKSPSHIIFEGRRASSRDALPKDLKGKKGKGKKGKPTNRGARRGAEWKKKQGSS